MRRLERVGNLARNGHGFANFDRTMCESFCQRVAGNELHHNRQDLPSAFCRALVEAVRLNRCAGD